MYLKSEELIARGIASSYLPETPIVYCFKKTERGKILIPCRYRNLKKEYKVVHFPEPNIELRPDQEKVLLEMRERANSPNACIPIFGHIYTGFGKSAITSMFAAEQKGPVLILCNTDAVRKGWVGTWKQFFSKEIHTASGSKLGQHDVCVCSIQLAVLNISTYKEDLKYYKTVICDEADTLCTQLSVNVLLELFPKFLLGCSATVRRSDGCDKVLDIFWGPRSNWIQRLKKFDEDCTMKLKVLYTSFPVESRYNKKNTIDWTGMCTSVSSIFERNILIRNLCTLHMDKKILILTKTKEHVTTLSSLLSDINIDVSTYFDKDKTYYDAHVLIATLSKAGRGYDDKQVSAAFDGRRFNVLILTITMKDSDQALGRALRGSELLVYQIVDDNKTMKNHAELLKKSSAHKGAKIDELFV